MVSPSGCVSAHRSRRALPGRSSPDRSSPQEPHCRNSPSREDHRSPITGRPLVELGLPAGTMIVLVEHGDAFVVPTGSTVLHEEDRLLILGNDDNIGTFQSRLEPPAES